MKVKVSSVTGKELISASKLVMSAAEKLCKSDSKRVLQIEESSLQNFENGNFCYLLSNKISSPHNQVNLRHTSRVEFYEKLAKKIHLSLRENAQTTSTRIFFYYFGAFILKSAFLEIKG